MKKKVRSEYFCFLVAALLSCNQQPTNPNSVLENILLLKNPTSGSVFHKGETVHINWAQDTSIIKSIDIFISTNGGVLQERINETSLPQNSSSATYSWIIPNGFPTSDSCVITISNWDNSYSSSNNGLFSIKP